MTGTELLIDPSTDADDANIAPLDETLLAAVPADAGSAEASPAEAERAAPTEAQIALADLDGRVAAVDARLSDLAGELGAAGVRTDAAESRLTAVEQSAVASAESIVSAAGRASAADGRLDSAEGRLDTTEGRLGATEAAVTTVSEQLETLTDRLAAVDGRLAAVDDHLATLRQRATDHDSALEDISRTIAAEVERHTSDALVESQHSLQLAVNSIAQLALAMAESSRDISEDVSAESATALLDSFRIDLDAILAQLGFESLATAAGDTFDPHRHRALKRVPTSDAAADKAITRVIRDGYRSTATGRILLFADVEVSRYRAQ